MKKSIAILILAVLFCVPGCGEDPLPDDVKALVGIEYVYPRSFEIMERYGQPETLDGTDAEVWVAYFPKGDFTIISKKGKNSRILKVSAGKQGESLGW